MLFLFLFAAPLVGAACEDEETAGPETGADVEDVAEDDTVVDDDEFGIYEDDELAELQQDTLVGQTVTVSADVNRILEPGKSIAIGEDTVEGGLLVLMPPQLKDVPMLEAGTAVQVSGTVVDFVVADIEADYDAFDLDDELYVDWEDENAIVARSISKAPAEEPAEPVQ